MIRFDGHTGKEERQFLADWRSPEQRQAAPQQARSLGGPFSADGRILVSSADEWVYVWDVNAGKLRHKIRHPHQHGCWLSLSPNGKTLATSDINYAGDPGQDVIRLFDVESGEQVMMLDPIDDRASVLAFSSDGARLVTGFQRGSAIIWDVRRVARPSDNK